MYAMRLVGPRCLVPAEVDIPDSPGLPPGQVRVRFRAGGICGSDKPGYLRGPAPDGVVTPGFPLHECVGTVLDAEDAELVGRRVIAIPRHADAMREDFLAPVEKVYPLNGSAERLPDEVAVVTQPLATVLAAADALGEVDGTTAVVLGLGSIGLLFGHVLRERGARRVIGVDPRPRVGVPLTTCFDEIHQAAHDVDETVDVCVEAAGHQQTTVAQAIALTRVRGRVLAFGVPDDEQYTFPYREFFTKSLSLVASVQPPWQEYLPRAESYLSAHQADLATLITHTYAVTDAHQAFAAAFGPDNATTGKVILVDRGWSGAGRSADPVASAGAVD